MAVARDDLGRAARKRGIEGQVTTIRHFGIRCMAVHIYILHELLLSHRILILSNFLNILSGDNSIK